MIVDDLCRSAEAFFRQGNTAGCWEQINIALNIEPDRAQALYLAGCAARAQGNLGVSLSLLRRALSIEKRVPNLWMHYGACLHDLLRYDEAREAFAVVDSMSPNDPAVYANIASTYMNEGNALETRIWAERALAINPESVVAKIAKAYAAMATGNWREGWQNVGYLYENHLEVRVYNPPESEEPQWDGSPGKTVVVECDQGVGDQLMFAQMLPEAARDCKELIVECAQRMLGLFRRSFPGIKFYGTLGFSNLAWPKNHQIDAHINISYLGRYYRLTDASFPRKAYLMPDSQLQAKWKQYLEQFPRPWVGIAWLGGLSLTNKAMRSVNLVDFAPVIERAGTAFDLSYTDERDEVARWNLDHRQQVRTPAIDTSNFDDTVALVSVLDEVVTVTTALSHVCGGLGRTAKVIVPKNVQWRYQHRCGDGMIWYPPDSVFLYRQDEHEKDLSGAIRRAALAMSEQVKQAA